MVPQRRALILHSESEGQMLKLLRRLKMLWCRFRKKPYIIEPKGMPTETMRAINIRPTDGLSWEKLLPGILEGPKIEYIIIRGHRRITALKEMQELIWKPDCKEQKGCNNLRRYHDD